MQRPPRPSASAAPSRLRGCLGLSLAAVAFLLVLVGLALISQGYLLLLLLIAGGVFAFVLLHYVVWGWWLGGMIRRDAERDEEEDAARDTQRMDRDRDE